VKTAAQPTSWLSPPAAARELGIDPVKIIAWIRSGELTAVDLSTRLGGRARWRISRESLDTFLANRACRPQMKAVRRKKRSSSVIEFF
jgi:hypothetical protein